MALNPAQHEAVTTLSGPLLVLAGAGTGKTRVVTHRVAELIRRGTPPGKILAVTFTKKAAGEMQQRTAGLLGRRLKAKPEISTFHSLCVKVLRRNAQRLGLPRSFVIYDSADQHSTARGALREIDVQGESLRPGDLLAIISRWKSDGLRPGEAERAAETNREHLAAMAYRRYQQALQAAGALDFDDLLLCSVELFAADPEARRQEAARFSHVLVDEYQDTNAAQYQVVKALAQDHRNLCVVGDDDQSIYGWRGADVAHILRFKDDWPEAKVVRLVENYRSTGPILEMSNRLIAFNRQRYPKQLQAARPGGEPPRILQFPDEVAEARAVTAEIRAQLVSRQARANDFAILFRTNEQTRSFETELRRIGLPYVVIGGTSFFDRKEVRDLLAYLKVIAHPRDQASLLRIINTPPRGLGATTVKRLLETALEQGRPLWDVLAGIEGFSAGVAEGSRRLRQLIGHFAGQFQRGGMAEALNELIEQIGYRQEVDRIYKDAGQRQVRWNTVQEMVNALGEYEQGASSGGTLHGFLDDVTLDPFETGRDKESKVHSEAVILMTLHSAKGLEFSQVYLVGVEEGVLPHRRSVELDEESIDEERRLCYVGMTRARDRLTLTLPRSRRKWGKPRRTKPSRFLYEMTGRAEAPT